MIKLSSARTFYTHTPPRTRSAILPCNQSQLPIPCRPLSCACHPMATPGTLQGLTGVLEQISARRILKAGERPIPSAQLCQSSTLTPIFLCRSELVVPETDLISLLLRSTQVRGTSVGTSLAKFGRGRGATVHLRIEWTAGGEPKKPQDCDLTLRLEALLIE